jgi:putative SOS response-associated peptidase YedK
MEPNHNRMPVILHPSEFDDWPNPHHKDLALLTDFLRPYSDDTMSEHIVSK